MTEQRDIDAVRVAVVGSVNVDQVIYCARIPAEGETLVAHRYAQGFGGKGANQAVMAARLGARVAMIGCLGDDDLGRRGRDNLLAHGVDVGGVATTARVESGVASIWVDDDGANRILIVAGANAELEAEHVRATLEAHPVDVVVAQLETPQSATAAAFAWARSVGALTIINPAPAAPLDDALLDGADWIVANESEFALLHGADPDERSVVVAAGSWDSGVVVTLGAEGAMLVAPGAAAAVVPAPPADAVDTTGAGDAFVGAFAVTLAAGWAPVEAVRAGCVAGSLSVRRPGTQTSFPTADDLLHPSVW